jgi:hypothetical protein
MCYSLMRESWPRELCVDGRFVKANEVAPKVYIPSRDILCNLEQT